MHSSLEKYIVRDRSQSEYIIVKRNNRAYTQPIYILFINIHTYSVVWFSFDFFKNSPFSSFEFELYNIYVHVYMLCNVQHASRTTSCGENYFPSSSHRSFEGVCAVEYIELYRAALAAAAAHCANVLFASQTQHKSHPAHACKRRSRLKSDSRHWSTTHYSRSQRDVTHHVEKNNKQTCCRG